MTQLSILIPARNEMWLKRTIEDILEHSEAETEIIAILDGEWADPELDVNPRVTVVHHEEPIGQRAGTIEAARLAEGKYIMKADAHCKFDQGFDRILLEDIKDDWTLIPRQYNLHVFNWWCPKCNGETYMGPTPVKCWNKDCDNATGFERKLVWEARWGRKSDSMRFDTTLHFQYWGELSERPEIKAQGDINDTMSFLGACWMTEKQRFFDLKLCGASFGSWGQMGTEIACKTWLSGGRLCVDKRTWFAHMFRTQGGDFSFPYEISGKQVERAREMTRDLFFNNKYEHQIYPLSWLIDKFKPIPDWHEEKGKAILDKVNAAGNDFYAKKRITKKKKEPTVGVLYYTDNRLNEEIKSKCLKQLFEAIGKNKIIMVKLHTEGMSYSITPDSKPTIYLELERGYLTMFKQILAGLEALDTDIVFFAEHDILYHPSHFDFRPPDPGKIYYNVNVWKVRWEDGHALHYDCRQTSGLCAYRDLLLEHYRERVRITGEKWNELGDTYQFRQFIRLQGFEPGTHGRLEYLRKYQSEEWQSKVPNIDIRHDKNLTPNRWSIDQFRRKPKEWIEADSVPGWDKLEVVKC